MIFIRADFICELCYKPGTGAVPETWSIILSSNICPECIERNSKEPSGPNILEIKCGAYAHCPDPRAAKAKALEGWN